MPQCEIATLYRYPVKSCRGTPAESVAVSPTGIEGDRQLLILRDGQFVNQARLANLAKVAPNRLDEHAIEFTAAGVDPWRHSIDANGPVTNINFYGNKIDVIDQGDALAEWLSDVVEAPVRAAALRETFTRAVPLDEFQVIDGNRQNRFVDIAPILLTNEASLEDLNSRLAVAVPMNRFRPNVVVRGLDAYAEDNLTQVAAGALRLIRATHCERCAVTCTDQETGARTTEPLATLKRYRHRDNGYAGGVMFGAYMAVTGNATLRVGDVLTY